MCLKLYETHIKNLTKIIYIYIELCPNNMGQIKIFEENKGSKMIKKKKGLHAI
jgi:hypothetical protein